MNIIKTIADKALEAVNIRIHSLELENARLREALLFYANTQVYDRPDSIGRVRDVSYVALNTLSQNEYRKVLEDA